MFRNEYTRRNVLKKTSIGITFAGAMVGITGTAQASPPWTEVEEAYAKKYNDNEASIITKKLKSIYPKVKNGNLTQYEGAELLADVLIRRPDTPLISADIKDYRKARELTFPEGTSYPFIEENTLSEIPELNDFHTSEQSTNCTTYPDIVRHWISLTADWGIPFFQRSGSYLEFDDSNARMEQNVVGAFGGGAIAQTEMFGYYRAQTSGIHELGAWVERRGSVRAGGTMQGSIWLFNCDKQTAYIFEQEVIGPRPQDVDGFKNYSHFYPLIEGDLYALGVQMRGEAQITGSLDPRDWLKSVVVMVYFGDKDHNNAGFFINNGNMRVRDPCYLA